MKILAVRSSKVSVIFRKRGGEPGNTDADLDPDPDPAQNLDAGGGGGGVG
jgi:hypothetical protein